MSAYATYSDLESRWRTLTPDEQNVADTLLGDAAVWLRSWFPALDARIAAGEVDSTLPIIVSCAMVKRAIVSSSNEGASNTSTTDVMGPFTSTRQVAFANPDGNLYVTAQERDMLDGRQSGAVSMECAGS